MGEGSIYFGLQRYAASPSRLYAWPLAEEVCNGRACPRFADVRGLLQLNNPPSRPHSLADKSFFGKFEAALDDYDQLPSLQDDDLCDICDALTSESALNQTQLQPHQPTTTLASDSILNAPEPSHELAKLAEHTRSSLMQRKPAAPASSQSQSRVTFALEPSASSIPEDTTAPAAPNKKRRIRRR